MPENTPRTPPTAIYVHWPWCKAKCPYCDFNSHATPPDEAYYIEGVVAELAAWRHVLAESAEHIDIHGDSGESTKPGQAAAEVAATGGTREANGSGGRQVQATDPRLAWDGLRPVVARGGAPKAPAPLPLRPLVSVFFGGGTPSLMAPGSAARVLDACAGLGVLDGHTEITLECNPTSFEDGRPAAQVLADFKAAGVNRVSLGVQGLDDAWLRFLGRSHSVRDALATLDAAQTLFDNVNADVIYGLPGQQLQAWQEQLETLAERGLAHISAYQLTIEPNTRFYKDVRQGLWHPLDGDVEADFFEATQGILTGRGYGNYEISNFARPGRACAHNLHVWRYGDYIGAGAGAHGRVTLPDGTRLATQVARQPEGYLQRLRDGKTTLVRADTVEGAQAVQEALFLGLRLREGVNMPRLEKQLGTAACEAGVNWVEHGRLCDLGLLETTDGHLRVTPRGWPLLNGVLTRLLDTRNPAETLPGDKNNLTTGAYTSAPTVVIE